MIWSLSLRLLLSAIHPPYGLEFLGVAPTLSQREEAVHEARAVRPLTAWREVQPIRVWPRVSVRVRLPALVTGSGSVTSRVVGTATTTTTRHKGVVIVVVVVVGRQAARVVLLSHALLSASLFAQLRGRVFVWVRVRVRTAFALGGTGSTSTSASTRRVGEYCDG